MDIRYYCSFCKKDFKTSSECKKHESLHKKIDLLKKKNPPKYSVGDRVKINKSTTIPAIFSMDYDIENGWMYTVGYDEYIHAITIPESKLQVALKKEQISNVLKKFNQFLHKSISSSLFAFYSENYDEECNIVIESDPKIDCAIKLLKTHIKDESGEDKTTHALYVPNTSAIKLIEFATFIPITNTPPSAVCWRKTRKVPYPVQLIMLSSEQYCDVVSGKIELPEDWCIAKALDLFDYI